MPMPTMDALQEDVLLAQERLSQTERVYGKDSAQYQLALKQFSQMWFVLKMARRKDEFFGDITLAASAMTPVS